MPRAPSYNPNQIAPAETTGARFRTPDFGPPAVAQGLANLGKAVNDYAIEEDKRDAAFDDTQSRKLATNALTELQGITNEYTSLRGGNATSARKGIDERLAKSRESYLGLAANDRQKRLLGERLDGLFGSAMGTIDKHYRSEEFTERLGTLATESAQFGDIAASTDDADASAGYIAQGKAVFQDGLRLKGVTDPEAVAFETLKYTDGVHTAKIDRWFASPNPDIDLIQSYVEAHDGEFTAAGYSKALERLQTPLQDRSDNAKLDGLFAQITPSTPVPPSGAGDPARMYSITAQTESGNKDYVGGKLITSPKGAQGRMQVMPGTQTDPGFGIRPAKDNSPDELARVGRDYLDAMMKRYGGDPAKAWAAYNAGPGAVDKALAGGGDWLSKMPAETRAYVGKNVAALGGVDNAPRSYDKAAVYDAIERAPGLLPEERERLKVKADRRIARDEQLLERQFRDAGREAAKIAAQLGDNFTSMSQIPSDLVKNMDPVEVAQMTDRIRQQNEARNEKAQAAAREQRGVVLGMMKRFEPEKYKALDPAKEIGRVPPSVLNTLLADQIEASKPVSFEAEGVRSGIQSEIAFQTKMGGPKTNDADTIKLYDAMEAQLQLIQRSRNGPLNKADYASAYQFAVRQRPGTGGFFSGDVRNYEVLSEVPDDVAAKIRDNWQGRAPPTRGQIIAAYRDMIGKR